MPVTIESFRCSRDQAKPAVSPVGRAVEDQSGADPRETDVDEVVVELVGLECGLRLKRLPIGDEVELRGARPGTKPAACRSLLVQEGVAQRTQEIAEVVLVAEQARPSEHACVGLLDEILGVLTRAAQSPRGPVEPVEMVS